MNKDKQPSGWIFASGIYEGYVRIPWDDKNEPRVSVPATCSVCGRKTDQGIEINHAGELLGFCTNRHYVEWWKTMHHEDSIRSEDFQSPEESHKEK
jgi:desulfoferrodoxin (superoxide reductase-like protein)